MTVLSSTVNCSFDDSIQNIKQNTKISKIKKHALLMTAKHIQENNGELMDILIAIYAQHCQKSCKSHETNSTFYRKMLMQHFPVWRIPVAIEHTKNKKNTKKIWKSFILPKLTYETQAASIMIPLIYKMLNDSKEQCIEKSEFNKLMQLFGDQKNVRIVKYLVCKLKGNNFATKHFDIDKRTITSIEHKIQKGTQILSELEQQASSFVHNDKNERTKSHKVEMKKYKELIHKSKLLCNEGKTPGPIKLTTIFPQIEELIVAFIESTGGEMKLKNTPIDGVIKSSRKSVKDVTEFLNKNFVWMRDLSQEYVRLTLHDLNIKPRNVK